MDHDKLRQTLIDLMNKYRKESLIEISEDLKIKAVGLDSIGFLNLFVEIEQTYEVDIDGIFAESFQMYTVGQFIDAVIEQINQTK